MQNLKIILQYDGSRYDGWQKQMNTSQTIQGKLESVLEKMTGQPVEVHGAGRTDAGVHAEGQTANFKLSEEYYPDQVLSYLNRYLPEDIKVLEISRAKERFHSRLNAVSKIYRYTVDTLEKKDVFQRKYVYGLGQSLDLNKMRQAAKLMTGEYDFLGFCSNKRMKKSSVRTIYWIHIEEQDGLLRIAFCGSGFLYHMVRIMTGTLIEIGLLKRPVSDIKKILETRDRQNAGFTAPPEGLALVSVSYEEN
ncbi:MAG: tRNA pseudouridine(38-40) synthase TruA [Lachnoclostridium edouardi]|uniref:tRNA pseudouridine(38-40) synthase TruA n=1 Tax=Lachnoclostridium edouardi TaxID=1926283 RepID=UPI0026DC04CB|nr:tRNA pseudouridine(38-40) synthase TruA [Lachnoclostridium edouardi]MDO4279297.1 tRNA pseudouridine(38-40) synthase TruA [Lachnoclostridium edouardi]